MLNFKPIQRRFNFIKVFFIIFFFFKQFNLQDMLNLELYAEREQRDGFATVG